MNKTFSTINKQFLTRWIYVAEQVGIPPRAYHPQVKLVRDETGKSSYTAGIIFNPFRLERPFNLEKSERCSLCQALKESQTIMPYKDIAPQISKNFLITANLFPYIIGSSIAISKEVNELERPMYNTRNLEGLTSELNEVFSIADKLGLKVFHNSYGAGASIPNHEHWHLLDFGTSYDQVGEKYGFDAAEKVSLKRNKKIRIMPGFPFAHLIFNREDLDLIVYFLGNLGEKIGKNYPCNQVPHTLSQGTEGILIIPYKIHKERCPGAADVAGHYQGCKTIKEFNNVTLDAFFSKMGEILFKRDELDLTAFLQ